ncbi:MAG: hypothetical protein ACYC3I_27725 [Gemmataceae bacterium]
MSRKLAFSVVSFLALMTLAVSAQEPNQPVPVSPAQSAIWGLTVNDPARFPALSGSFGTADHRSRQEENDLIRKSQELVKQLAKAEGESREKIKTKLSETLDKQFDVRQKRHEAELKALEDQVKKLREMVQKRQENRREIIGKRLELLVRESEGLGW